VGSQVEEPSASTYVATGPLAAPPCRILLVPRPGSFPQALTDVAVDESLNLGPDCDGVERFRQVAAANQNRTVVVTAPVETLALLLGHITRADAARFVVRADSFSVAEVGEDGRGVLHVFNWDADHEPSPPAVDTCRVHLLRHGQAMLVEHGGQVWSHHPIGLTARGQEQARDAAERLRTVPLAAVYASDLPRAIETATHIAGPHGLEPVVDAALKEIALGDFEGLTLAAVHESGDTRFLPWLEVTFNEEFPHEGFHHPADLVFPGGESILIEHERVLAAFQAIVARHRGESIAIVSHTWAIQPLVAYVVDGNPRDYYRFGLRYATDTVVEVPAAQPGALFKLNANLALDEVAGSRFSRRGER
jgi:broad specificity phosphatase PhoE